MTKKHEGITTNADFEGSKFEKKALSTDMLDQGEAPEEEEQDPLPVKAKTGGMLTTADLPQKTPRPPAPAPRSITTEQLSRLPKGQKTIERVYQDGALASLSVPDQNRLESHIQDGAWKGRPCFIIGGGPSLRGFDFEVLKGELVIGVNRAYEFMPWLPIAFSIDLRYWMWLIEGRIGKNGKETRQKWLDYKGAKVWMIRETEAFTDCDDHMICRRNDDALTGESPLGDCSIAHGFETPCDSGYAAVQLAIALGANPIYLLGFDMKGDGKGKQDWYHDGYPLVQDEKRIYEGKYIPKWKRLPFLANLNQTEIVNLNPESALEMFPKEEFPVLPTNPRRMPQVVSFVTRNTGYEAEGFSMARSAQMFGVDAYIETVDSTGTWEGNCLLKAEFILRMAEKFDGCLWIDADTRFLRYPSELYEIPDEADVGLLEFDWSQYKAARDDKEVMSGLLYVNNSKAALAFVRKWAKKCKEMAGRPVWDQWLLSTCVAEEEKRANSKTKFMRWPRDLCQIDRILEDVENPLFRFLQASRRLRKEVNAKGKEK